MTPGSTTATRFSRSMSLIFARACVARTMPPATGTAPPVRPVPPARSVTGTPGAPATARGTATSAASAAMTTASGGRPPTSLSSTAYGPHASSPVSTFEGPRRRSSSALARSIAVRPGSATSGARRSIAAWKLSPPEPPRDRPRPAHHPARREALGRLHRLRVGADEDLLAVLLDALDDLRGGALGQGARDAVEEGGFLGGDSLGAARDVGADAPRMDARDVDGGVGELHHERLGETEHRVLGDVVRPVVDERHHRVDARDVDDVPLGALLDERQDRLHAADDTPHVDADDELEVLVRDLLERGLDGEARVVDDDVGPAVAALDVAPGAVDGVAVAGVAAVG